MLIFSNDDIDSVLTMEACIAAFEQTYRDVALGETINGRRSDMITPTSAPDAVYSLKMLGAVAPRYHIGAVRINSDILSFPKANGATRKVKIPAAPGARWVGLVMLFDTGSGVPLALFPDGVLQRMRVGASSGLGVRYLAREDARRAAILGSGWQAFAQAEAVAAVRTLDRLDVYSPDEGRRRAFAARMERKLGIEVHAAASAREAVSRADIVLCATNSLQPVLDGDALRPGMHLGSIRSGEIAGDALGRLDRLVVHDPGNMGDDHLVVARGISHREQGGGHGAAFAHAPSLADLVSGAASGRRAASEITGFLNYHGLGYQFAAAGAVLLEKALAAGRGVELPDEWFTQDVHS
ncbi:ornithine cyclodeaminase family protein [Sodalis sp. RH21]|uniref:ornithine cyclodeaminase family protein n=1 Tax=unclassified Sodalis (in: enterobacteria) TaxID=2636512 RepID=UPI0039B4AFB1